MRPSYFLLTLLLFPALAAADTLSGRVVKVVDGDTVYVLDANQERHKIRLGGIDAPERGQPFGKRSKERMSELVAGQDVTVSWHKADRWGRLIGTARVASPDCRTEPCPKTLNAGLALITSGLRGTTSGTLTSNPKKTESDTLSRRRARARRTGLCGAILIRCRRGRAQTVALATHLWRYVPEGIDVVPIVVLVGVILASILACHAIAQRRGRNPVFWGVMGAVFGPLAIPFALMSKPKRQSEGDPGT